MKKISILLIALTALLLTGCASSVKSNKVEMAKLNENGDIVIDTTEITDVATFYTYEHEGVTIEFFAVKANDGTIRTAFNTCQVCNGSPHAYFIQKGDIFECQNCGNTFSVDDIEIIKGGCNPIPITGEDKLVEDNIITIKKELIESYKQRFSTIEKI